MALTRLSTQPARLLQCVTTVCCLYYCITASRFCGYKGQAHTHTLICCIASQHTLNQRRLQQYSTPTVYLSPKLPFPHCASSFLFNFPPNTHACELLPHQLTCHASTPAFPGAHPSMDTHFDCPTQLPDQPPASIATPIPFVDLCMIA